jgi:hypothetical protein
MLRTTHKAIAERNASEIGFSEEKTKIFISGSTGPDSHGDFPHATGHNCKILSKIDRLEPYFYKAMNTPTVNFQTHFTSYATNDTTTLKLRPNWS